MTPPREPTPEAVLQKQPLACRGVLPGTHTPTLLRKEWFIECIKNEKILATAPLLDTAPFELLRWGCTS
jgi:hypothetical protein